MTTKKLPEMSHREHADAVDRLHRRAAYLMLACAFVALIGLAWLVFSVVKHGVPPHGGYGLAFACVLIVLYCAIDRMTKRARAHIERMQENLKELQRPLP